MMKSLIAVAGAGLLAAACTSTGAVERNAAGGAALGALAGAVIGNNVGSGDAGTGAAIGAIAGGAAGAYKGCREDGGCGADAPNRRQYYDERAGRYYFYDPSSQRYYWENGQPRY
jgi:phage tail tape-measure protein